MLEIPMIPTIILCAVILFFVLRFAMTEVSAERDGRWRPHWTWRGQVMRRIGPKGTWEKRKMTADEAANDFEDRNW